MERTLLLREKNSRQMLSNMIQVFFFLCDFSKFTISKTFAFCIYLPVVQQNNADILIIGLSGHASCILISKIFNNFRHCFGITNYWRMPRGHLFLQRKCKRFREATTENSS